MDKKLSEFKLAQGSSNVSAANEAKSFSCRICDDTNHDASYCGVQILSMWQLRTVGGATKKGLWSLIMMEWPPWVIVVKVKCMLIKVPTTTNPLDLPSISILAKENSTKARNLTIMCLIAIKPVGVFLGLIGIGHIFRCQAPTPNSLTKVLVCLLEL